MKETGARSPSAAGSAPKVLGATGHEVFSAHLQTAHAFTHWPRPWGDIPHLNPFFPLPCSCAEGIRSPKAPLAASQEKKNFN